MIEVQVPKDVSVYESPLIGPLTSRQAVCLAAAAAVEYIYYNVIQMLNIGIDMNTMLCIGIILAVPILYMAVGKPYGMRPEVYIYYYFLPSILSNKDRPYETKLTYDTILEEIEKEEQMQEAAKNGKKVGQATNKKQGKKKQNSKTKRVRSKQDIMYL